ncbi:hypothetical protein [Maledivibacter halophilus]|uniref:Mg2+ and Co2+ transporter CorB n=1 Tax=Maledivibacter halophilus TaxID=36842 RepID=A0A1T5LA29_9FIRM|nr:hypothetical protein [Maledivibacter halophilus]SKC72278.1 hypothetical protein SAMN02194393_02597 [Maledivibacter halophilus]
MDKNNKDKNKKSIILRGYNIKWVLNITIVTFILAVFLSFASEAILRNTEVYIAFLILIVIVFLGITSDLIGIAVAIADEKPFHSMAAKKIHGAKFAIKLIKNAGPVSNFCNDVIGDIAGIISGAAGAIILIEISKIYNLVNTAVYSVILSGIVAAVTVGGKALGKEIALRKSKEIVFGVAKILYWIKNKFKIDFLPENNK